MTVIFFFKTKDEEKPILWLKFIILTTIFFQKYKNRLQSYNLLAVLFFSLLLIKAAFYCSYSWKCSKTKSIDLLSVCPLFKLYREFVEVKTV